MDRIDALHSRACSNFYARRETPLKISVLVCGILLVCGAILTHFLHVNSIAVYTLGGFGGFCIISGVISLLFHKKNETSSRFPERAPAARQGSAHTIDNLEVAEAKDKNEADIKNILRQWIAEKPDEQRQTAADRFLDCFKNQDDLLDLDHLGLTTLPDIFGYFPWLGGLDLASNYLQILPPSIVKLANLEYLSLSDNGLQSLPNHVVDLESLTDLFLQNNSLRDLPGSVERLRNLDTLDIDDNQFESLPEAIKHFHRLKTILLRGNRLRQLPDWLFQMRTLNALAADRNAFSPANVEAIQDEVARIRIERPEFRCRLSVSDYPPVYQLPNANEVENLADLILFWEKQFAELAEQSTGQAYALSSFQTVATHPAKDFLSTFLQKAKACEDFKQPENRSLMIIEIHEMLSAMEADQGFRDLALVLIEEADATCGDRVALFLNYLRIQRISSHAQHLNDVELAELLIGLARLDKVDAISKKQSEQAVDPLQVILGYQVKLRKKLSLPLVTHTMLYPSLAKIDAKELESATQKVLHETQNFSEILSTSKPWVDRLKARHQNRFQEIGDQFVLPDPGDFPKEQAYREGVAQIQQIREIAMQNLVIELTQQWLKAEKLFDRQKGF